MFKRILHMLVWSFKYDYIFLFRIPGIQTSERIRFVILKYFRYVKDSVFGLRGGISSINVFGRSFYYNDAYGPTSLQRVYCEHYALKDHVAGSPVVVDVGAHIGQFNFFCSHYLGARRIVSIEPLPGCFELLQMNALDPNECIRMAAGGHVGTITIYVASASSQQSTYVKDANDTYVDSFDVPSETLDGLMNKVNLSIIDILKIDTEGSEYEILCHAKRMLDLAYIVAVEMSVLRTSTGSLFQTGRLLEENLFALAEIDCFRPLNTSAANGVFRKESSKRHDPKQ